MPEAAVHENHRLVMRENDVRLSCQPLVIFSETEAELKKLGTQRDFKLSTSTVNGRHVFVSLLRILAVAQGNTHELFVRMTAGKKNVRDFCARNRRKRRFILTIMCKNRASSGETILSFIGRRKRCFCPLYALFKLGLGEFKGKGYVGKEIFRDVVAVSTSLKMGKKRVMKSIILIFTKVIGFTKFCKSDFAHLFEKSE